MNRVNEQITTISFQVNKRQFITGHEGLILHHKYIFCVQPLCSGYNYKNITSCNNVSISINVNINRMEK